MATEILDLGGSNSTPNRVADLTSANSWILELTIGTVTLNVGDIVLYSHNEERNAGATPGISAPAGAGEHPASGTTFAVTNLNTSDVYVSTGWTDLGYSRGGNSDRQCTGVFGKELTATDILSGAAALVCRLTVSGPSGNDELSSHQRIQIIRGAAVGDDILEDIATMSIGTGTSVDSGSSPNGQNTDEVFWDRPSNSSVYNGSTPGMDNPLVLHYASWRRNASLLTNNAPSRTGYSVITQPVTGLTFLAGIITNLNFDGSGETFNGGGNTRGNGFQSLCYFEKYATFNALNAGWAESLGNPNAWGFDTTIGGNGNAGTNGFAAVSIIIPEEVAATYNKSLINVPMIMSVPGPFAPAVDFDRSPQATACSSSASADHYQEFRKTSIARTMMALGSVSQSFPKTVVSSAVTLTKDAPLDIVDFVRSETAESIDPTGFTNEIYFLQVTASSISPTALVDNPVDFPQTPTATQLTMTGSATYSLELVHTETVTSSAITATGFTNEIYFLQVTSSAITATGSTEYISEDAKQVTSSSLDPTGQVIDTVDFVRTVTASAITFAGFTNETYFVQLTSSAITATSSTEYISEDAKQVTASAITATGLVVDRTVSSSRSVIAKSIDPIAPDREFYISITRVATAVGELGTGQIIASYTSNAPVLSAIGNIFISITPKKFIHQSVTSAVVGSAAFSAYPSSTSISINPNMVISITVTRVVTSDGTMQTTALYSVTKIVSQIISVTTSTDITGGMIQKFIQVGMLSSGDTGTAGSAIGLIGNIDGIGSVDGAFNQTMQTVGDIDGVATIDANLLKGVDIVTIEEIWNVALVELGVSRVNTEGEQTPQAILLSAVWNGGFRQQFLADHAFNGAKSTISLSRFQDSEGDNVKPGGSRWASAFLLPDDYIRALGINGLPMQPNSSMGKNQWEIEIVSDKATVPTLKRCLVTNVGSVDLQYVMDIGNDNISLLSPLIAHAFGMALAAHVATNFGKSASEQALIQQRASESILAAQGVDGQESSAKLFGSTAMLDVRR